MHLTADFLSRIRVARQYDDGVGYWVEIFPGDAVEIQKNNSKAGAW